MHLVKRGFCFVILLSSMSLSGAMLASAKECMSPQQRPSVEKERTVLDTLRHSRRFRLLRTDSLHNGLSYLINPSNGVMHFDSLHDGLSYFKNPGDEMLHLEGNMNSDSLLEGKGGSLDVFGRSEFPWNAAESATTPESLGTLRQKYCMKKSTPKQRAKPAPETTNGPKIWLLTER
jgi:hypothetical protein